MGILLPCELSTWPSVTSYLSVLASGLDNIRDVIVILLQIHDLCNVAILNEEDARLHDEHMFDHLNEVIENQFSAEDRERFLKKTLPCIARFGAALPQFRPSKFEYILASRPSKLQLDRRFVASLAANAFLSTLPLKAKELWPHGMPDVTFATLFPELSKDFCSALRFKGFLEYFDILEEEGPCGRVSYELFVQKNVQKDNSVKDVPRKTLAPVFIVEEDIRPLDLTANVDRLIVRDMENISDLNLQHPELIPLLIATEPKLKENEWIEVKGLMSRSIQLPKAKKEEQTDDTCICIVERTSGLVQDQVKVAQNSCFQILQNCFEIDVKEEEKSRTKTASMSSKLPSSWIKNASEDEDESSEPEESKKGEDENQRRPKRQSFADRLRMALERGNTPDGSSSQGQQGVITSPDPESASFANKKRRFLSDDDQGPERTRRSDFCESRYDDDGSIFSDDSMYSFESLLASFDMEADIEDMQADLLKPLHQDENHKLRSLAITDDLKRMSLSEAYINICQSLHNPITKTPKIQRYFQSDPGFPFFPQKYKKQRSKAEEPNGSRLPIWIVNHSTEVDSKRFLIEWLSASVQDVPLVVYQSSNGSISTDVIAAICSWIEEQAWTTEELHNALLHGGSSAQFI